MCISEKNTLLQEIKVTVQENAPLVSWFLHALLPQKKKKLGAAKEGGSALGLSDETEGERLAAISYTWIYPKIQHPSLISYLVDNSI